MIAFYITTLSLLGRGLKIIGCVTKKSRFFANFSKKSPPRPSLSLINFLKIFVNLGFRNLTDDQFSNHDKSWFLFKNSFNDARARYLFPWTLKIWSTTTTVIVANPHALSVRLTHFEHPIQWFCKGGPLQIWQKSTEMSNLTLFDIQKLATMKLLWRNTHTLLLISPGHKKYDQLLL